MTKTLPKRTFNNSMMADDLRLMPNHRCFRPDIQDSGSKASSLPVAIPISQDPSDPSLVLADTPFIPASLQLYVNGVCYFPDDIPSFDSSASSASSLSLPGLDLLDDIRLFAIPA